MKGDSAGCRYLSDLFHRLDVFRLRIPPLRERPEDVLPLARFFLAGFAARAGRAIQGLSPDTERRLLAYAFPGNVRELRNLLEHVVVYAAAPEVAAEHLPAHVAGGKSAKKQSLEERERAYILEVLDFTRGKKSKAAAILGISRKTLLEKRKRYKLD